MDIGKAIKLCRIQKGLRQIDLASKSQISTAYLSLIEQGKRDPNFSVLQKISKNLNVPLSILVFLAAGNNEMVTMSPELYEKLSSFALRLVDAGSNENT